MTTIADFVNAQEMHLRHPETFDAPAAEELSGLAPGDLVKVCAGGERFWVKLTGVTDGVFTGAVDNHLTETEEHGLGYTDTVTFGREHVYDVFKATGGPTAGREEAGV